MRKVASENVLKYSRWSIGDITRSSEIHNLKFVCTNKMNSKIILYLYIW